ncbi:MAG: PIN domain-containing protein [Chloroflexi bacterium]|nr:PIN domain-containing protein [Chloroflexota bacterium]
MAGDIVDTTVLVDVLREDAVAIAFLDGVAAERRPLCPDVVLAELIVGCRGRAEIKKVKAFVADVLELAMHDAADARLALELLEQHHPSHGLGYHDCLIAAMAVNRDTVLYTTNARHFVSVSHLTPVSPIWSRRFDTG